MNFEKEYIIQAINVAANNLRLDSSKREVVTLLRKFIESCNDLDSSILAMKKITEFSKFAIKLGEIQKYISFSKVDFLTVSEKFKEHSGMLIRELNCFLDVVSPNIFNEKISFKTIQVESKIAAPMIFDENSNDLKEIELVVDDFIYSDDFLQTPNLKKESETTASLKRSIVYDDEPQEINFENFEDSILKFAKQLDIFFESLLKSEYTYGELETYIRQTSVNLDLSRRIGMQIVTNMHRIVLRSLELIRDGLLAIDESIIESMRACLIVILAVVRRKDVDITNYLNIAEYFGKQISL